MKKIWIVVAALVASMAQLPAADALTEALQKGLFEEEANQNLEAAIKAYQDVLSRADEQRRVAATALFRLAECYRKQGKTNEAAGEYRRVVRDYADQTMLANLSRQNLTGLGVSSSAVAAGGATTPEGTAVASTDEEEKEIRRIKALIKDSPDLINARNQTIYSTGSGDSTRSYLGTVLHLAAYRGHVQVARYLLENGANVNAISSEDATTPLYYAAQNGHRNLAELLLSKGADPNFGAGTSYRGTPLHAASSKGFPAVAQVLLAHNADVNATDFAGKTPLHYAVEAGFLPVAELLIARGANVNASYALARDPNSGSATRVDIYDGTPLHFAVQKRNIEIVRLLLSKGADMNARSGAGLTPLHYTGHNGNAPIAGLLVDNKADVNAQGSSGSRFSGWTALHMALYHRATNVVQLLLDKGADPNLAMDNAKTLEYRTALHNAVEYGYAREVELLLNHKADVNAPDFFDNTPLLRATKKNDASIIKLLLEHGADINAVDSNGNTALANAVQNDQRQVAELLLAKGADPNGVNGGGASLLSVAAGLSGSGYPARPLPPMSVPRVGGAPKPEPRPGKTMVELLVDYKADVNGPVTREGSALTALQHVVINRMTNWVRLFLDKGGDPNLPLATPLGQVLRTPLQVAVEQQGLAIADMLLTHKADVNALDDYGWTPLFRAVSKGDNKMVELLLSHNADVGALIRDEATPLAKAVESQNAAIVEQLLEKGADPNVSIRGAPLLHFAINLPAQPGITGGVPMPGVAQSGVPYMPVPAQSIPSRVARQPASNPTFNPNATASSASPKPPSKTEKSILELLLQYKADPNIRTTIPEQDSQTPLHVAARNGNEAAAKLLLAYKADVNARSDSGTTPLHVAAQSQSSSFVELLLTNKANINATRNRGQTPMHWAASYSGNTNVMSLLVERGADLNVCDTDGDTPLLNLLESLRSRTIQPAYFATLEFFLRLGADVTKSCEGKPTPFEYVVKSGFQENIVDLLRRFHPAKLSRIRLSGPVQQYAWYFETDKGATLSQAIAALGLSEKANPRNISVLRDDPKTGLKEQRGYDLVAIRLKDAQDVPLRDGDKIIVAER